MSSNNWGIGKGVFLQKYLLIESANSQSILLSSEFNLMYKLRYEASSLRMIPGSIANHYVMP